MIRKYAESFCWKNVSSFCNAKATHIFSAKNIRILCIESAKTVNEMTLNELVKLTTLWTIGPSSFWPKKSILSGAMYITLDKTTAIYFQELTLQHQDLQITWRCSGRKQRHFLHSVCRNNRYKWKKNMNGEATGGLLQYSKIKLHRMKRHIESVFCCVSSKV